jgi:hypothetical protein
MYKSKNGQKLCTNNQKRMYNLHTKKKRREQKSNQTKCYRQIKDHYLTHSHVQLNMEENKKPENKNVKLNFKYIDIFVGNPLLNQHKVHNHHELLLKNMVVVNVGYENQ